uniref:Galectin n=1 Tax=Moschus moschiferus TaxID=68415 RepID=A0A8C6G010_MOSMO
VEATQPIQVGMSIYIQGVASEHMKRFFVNFEVGHGQGADVAFHFNPRFDGWDKVVLNSKQNGSWGNEERKMSMPFRKGAAFELVFMVLTEHFKVYANGQHLFDFSHRFSAFQRVDLVEIHGDVTLSYVQI